MQIISLSGSDNDGSAVNPKPLTTACMGRYHLINQIKVQLGSKLGKAALMTFKQPPFFSDSSAHVDLTTRLLTVTQIALTRNQSE